MKESFISKFAGVTFLLILAILCANIASAQGSTTDYSTLKKFLNAKMYTEAYLEMLRCELSMKDADPKIVKLKKDLLVLARKEASARAKVQPNDSMVFTVLADIDFQEALADSGMKNITQALSGNPNDITHYVFAKLLYFKGNVNQCFEEMEKALHINPASEAIFEDFNFIYYARAYGVAAAKRSYPNSGFLSRTSPVAPKSGIPKPPDSPFENDPTHQGVAINPPPPEPDESSTALGSSLKTGSTTGATTGTKPIQVTQKPPTSNSGKSNLPPLPDEIPDSPDDLNIGFPNDTSMTPASTSTGPKTAQSVPTSSYNPTSSSTFSTSSTSLTSSTLSSTLTSSKNSDLLPPRILIGSASVPTSETFPVGSDPEEAKMKESEKWISSAKTKIQDGNLEDAAEIISKIEQTNPDSSAAKDLRAKIEGIKTIEKNFKRSVAFYEEGNYDEAKDGFIKAYESDPKKYSQATFYIGKVLLLGTEKDYAKSREYFEKFLALPGTDKELKRDVEWVVIGILADEENYEEAYKRFNEFVSREPDYAKNRESFRILKYRLWYRNYQTEVLTGIGIFVGAFAMVFLLMFLPAFKFFTFDPIKKAKHALDSGNWEKAVQVAENALRRGKQPIQIERQLLEIAVEGHFQLKNYFKCQDHARHLLSLFSDNMIAWKYVAKASLYTNDTSDEAISMYENAYKQNPENTEYLEILAKHYSGNKIFTVEAMEVIENFYQIDPTNRDIAVSLGEAFIQNKRMDEKVILVLQQALKFKPDHLPFRELLARSYSKAGKFNEASRECLSVLNSSINNMGIHVVYTTCMKKLGMLDEAILQYEEFSRRFPDNPQISEILTGLRKDLETSGGSGAKSGSNDGFSTFSEEMMAESLMNLPSSSSKSAANGQFDAASFVEPLPDELLKKNKPVPVPEFLKKGDQTSKEAPAVTKPDFLKGKTALPKVEFDDSLLPPLKPGAKAPTSGSIGSEKPDLPPRTAFSVSKAPGPKTPGPRIEKDSPESDKKDSSTDSKNFPSSTIGESIQQSELAEARIKAAAKKWDDVVNILSPVFATTRKKEIGIFLADAYLNLKKPEMAREILETLELDPELIDEPLKDLLYRTATGLEEIKSYQGALKMYDLICNADINYLDAFDRSDRLYNTVQKKKA
ncbi:MAG: hypothetical protein HQM08_02100 [Candidatus Riflebacteria bacterium]|nr:hypothetical protein [Candidatus Riflebacteria bacterium]